MSGKKKEWEVEFDPDFKAKEFDHFPLEVKEAILAKAKLLQKMGPELGRPHADTLYDSKHANMKELRCEADNGVWRVVFAFDPVRRAFLLAAGDKSGVKEKRFYRGLIKVADARFDAHLKRLKGTK